ncbi:MAG: hypothetical protein JWP27_3063, partial [Flaviaesturariibacter sp.]|nr:hypothetical protein [Flaviaesturariibacter sp.]
MTTATAPNRRNLSPAQRDALAEIEQYGAVALSDPFGRSNQRTLQSLVDRGLAEWHEADVLRVYPRIVPVGTSARWRAAAAAEAERKAQARLARIDL